MNKATIMVSGCVLLLAGLLPTVWVFAADKSVTTQPRATADESLAKLKAGNERFVTGQSKSPRQHTERVTELAAGQDPFAVVLTCSDSRVSPEILFDQGFGDLFVIRVAGNILEPGGLASAEYAVEMLKTKLIVVLGHEECGAVAASIKAITTNTELPGNLQTLVKDIRPAVETAKAQGDVELGEVIDHNVDHVVNLLTKNETLMTPYLESGELRIVGAVYNFADGSVTYHTH